MRKEAARALAVVGAAALAVASTGCASSQKLIDTKSAQSAFRQAGFRDLVVRRSSTADVISTPGSTLSTFAPLIAVRFATVDGAQRRLANDQPLLHGTLSPQERSALPQGFDIARLVDVRVCNVVLTSYDTDRNRSLAARIERAVGILRQKC